MKFSFYILLVLLNSTNLFSQLESIKEFPKEYESQEIKELTPVWISENEILAFYSNSTLDTIFSRRTTNRGLTWSTQKYERYVVSQSSSGKTFLTAVKGGNDRIILAWSDTTAIMIYSDDKGLSWSHSTLPHPEFFAKYMGFFNMGSGRILFSFLAITLSYIISYDNGETWSFENKTDLPTLSFPTRTFSIVATSEDSIVCTFPRLNVEGVPVYSIVSVDGGETWSDTVRVALTHFRGGYSGPNVCSGIDDEKNLWVFFDHIKEIGFEEYNQQDVSVFKSSNFGLSWQKMNSFTKYLGGDFLDNIAILDGKFFVTFHSSRSSVIEQSFYGILGESADVFTPPVLLGAEVTDVDHEKEEFSYQALIIDEDAVSQVTVELEDGAFIGEMFDDGMHNDSLDSDNIYGNTFPILTPTSVVPYYGKRYALDVNKINLPLNNSGILAGVNFTHLSLLSEFKMYDIYNNVRIERETARVPVMNPGSGGKYEEGGFLFSGGFWLSGYNGDSLWSNAVASASLVEDYLPGKVGSEPDDALNRIYIVNINDVPFGYTWQNWKDAVSLGAEFYDGDGDGIYNPVDKNWNDTWDPGEDMPMLIGNETIWCVYNDGMPSN
ncbi:MAG: sialidase family protein, partial [Ignavibacteriaceae bacterium]